MEKDSKNKNELIKEAQELADKIIEKKSIIETALNDLDSKKKIDQTHIDGMSIIENIFNEIEALEFEQIKIFEKIKKT